MGDFADEFAAPFGAKPRGGAAPKIIGRVLVYASDTSVTRTVTAPKGATSFRASACGSGGMGFYGSPSGAAGGGGVGYFEGTCSVGDNFLCVAGQSRTGSGWYGAPGVDSTVTFNSKELCAGLGGAGNGGNPIGGAGGGWRGQYGVNGGKGGDLNPAAGSNGLPGESVGGCPGGWAYMLGGSYPGLSGGGAPGALGFGAGFQQSGSGRLGGGGTAGLSGVAAPSNSGEGWCLLEFYG